jgi:hypothetical protein
MHPTAERLSVGIQSYLRRVMGNVIWLCFWVVAVLNTPLWTSGIEIIETTQTEKITKW